MNHLRQLLCVTAVGLPSAGAVELLLGDVEATLDLPPLAIDFDLDDGERSRSGNDGFDYGSGLSLGLLRGFPGPGASVGPYLAGHITAQYLAYDDDDGALDTLGLRASGGLAWAIDDRWMVAAGPHVDLGLSRMDLPQTGSHAGFDGDGLVYGGGVEMRARMHMHEAWALSMRVGYGHYRHQLEDGHLALDLEQRGFFLGLGISYRLLSLPAALE